MTQKSSISGVGSAVLLTGLLAGCASIGTPGGGLYDETPPVFVSSDPADGETNVTKKKFTLKFNENIKLDNALDKITVSPPQQKSPTILSNAKTVTIELQDSLRPNTTYSVSLGDAVQDNNEGNVLEHTSFTFSTGDHIDSLHISGYLLNAEDLEPVTGAYVGIYPDTAVADSIFMLESMQRAGKTDAYGRYSIEGIARGSYRLYAIVDGNTNYRYDLRTENIAFCDSLISPSMSGTVEYDTIWADLDSTRIDTVLTRNRISYAPENVTMLLFSEGKYNRYLEDTGRPDSCLLRVRFAAPMESLPVWSYPADSTVDAGALLLAEPNPTLDTLSYWITDTAWINRDTLTLGMTYMMTDTAGVDVPRTDTIQFVRPPRKTGPDNAKSGGKEKKKGWGLFGGKNDKKDKDKKDKHDRKPGQEAPTDSLPAIVFMSVKQLGASTLNIGQKPKFEVSTPLASIDVGGLHLKRQVNDSTWTDMKFRWEKDSLKLRSYQLFAVPYFSPGEKYKLVVDSACMYDIYGNPVNRTELSFSEHKPEEYAHLLFQVKGISGKAFVCLLNDKDKVVQRADVKGNQAKFVNVLPGTYYARMVEDLNGNGVWDHGTLTPRRQPEPVYYFNGELSLRANWSISQNWDVDELPLYKQKPLKVTQNKPKEKQEKKSKNAEYYAKMGITPPQTNSGTTTSGANSSLHSVGN